MRKGACSGARCWSGVYSPPVPWSTSTAWRWENVPRRESCPDRRTGMPSRSNEPNASSSAVPQSTASWTSIWRRWVELARELGVDVETLGERGGALQDLLERGQRDGGRRRLGDRRGRRAVRVARALGGALSWVAANAASSLSWKSLRALSASSSDMSPRLTSRSV